LAALAVLAKPCISLSFEGARLYRLRKKAVSLGFVTGHDFSRADKANNMNRALAQAKAHSCDSLESGLFSAACFELRAGSFERARLQPCQ
jgi:hypothetical protein